MVNGLENGSAESSNLYTRLKAFHSVDFED